MGNTLKWQLEFKEHDDTPPNLEVELTICKQTQMGQVESCSSCEPPC